MLGRFVLLLQTSWLVGQSSVRLVLSASFHLRDWILRVVLLYSGDTSEAPNKHSRFFGGGFHLQSPNRLCYVLTDIALEWASSSFFKTA